MSWLERAGALEAAGIPHVIVTVLGARGSTPRDSGTKMVVTADGSYCTIGGGHLEFRSMEIAREMLLSGDQDQRLESFPLVHAWGSAAAAVPTCCSRVFPVMR